MHAVTLPTVRARSFAALGIGLILLSATAFSAVAQVPPARLNLADIIVALRSQKVSLDERNKLLTDAVLVRGITFALTPEIEKELESTGADKNLVTAIKSRSSAVKVSAVVPPGDPVKQPEYLTHLQQADASFARDDLDSALVEYSKALLLQPSISSAYFSRGRIFLTRGLYEQAISDFSRSIEIEPQNTAAFANRAQAWVIVGNNDKAVADYTRVLELKPNDAAAKANLDRIKAAEATSRQETVPTQAATPVALRPTSDSPANVGVTADSTKIAGEKPADSTKSEWESAGINVGALLAANAVKLQKPLYPPIAVRGNITGKVSVLVLIDENGNVVSAKATDGPQLLRLSSENAARRSKFKQTFYQGQPVKVTGVITYNYLPKERDKE